MTTLNPSFQMLPLHAIVPSPANPHKHFDQAAESHDGAFDGHNWAKSERSDQRYDARPLVSAWGAMS
jgi:hypothetical protein